MKVVINQSNYLPWKGYFDLIHDADLFIFHDDLQYTKNDWRNRNRIKTPRGAEWLTIPVGTDEHRLINEVRLPEDSAWARQHWRLIRENYRTAPYFTQHAPWLEDVLLGRRWHTLSELNQSLIQTIARDHLGITTRFRSSTEFGLSSRKQQRVLDLLAAAGAHTYISGPAAKAYLDEASFQAAGIRLVWKNYAGYPEYAQPHPPFEHAVSILDLLFSTGPAATDHIWGWRRTKEAT